MRLTKDTTMKISVRSSYKGEERESKIVCNFDKNIIINYRIHSSKNHFLLIRSSESYNAKSADNVLDIERPLQPTTDELDYYRVVYGDDVINNYLACVNYYWKRVDGKPKYNV